mmetsp:Transcript_108172/g.304710  ORF Transcript_108172/g.304710 Transcript_108172/m.304710 type:complete len:257 (-) Transcript_108172:23-793(-)
MIPRVPGDDVPGARQGQGDGDVRGRVGDDSRRVSQGHATGSTRVTIDMVVACPEVGDDAEAREACEDRVVDRLVLVREDGSHLRAPWLPQVGIAEEDDFADLLQPFKEGLRELDIKQSEGPGCVCGAGGLPPLAFRHRGVVEATINPCAWSKHLAAAAAVGSHSHRRAMPQPRRAAVPAPAATEQCRPTAGASYDQRDAGEQPTSTPLRRQRQHLTPMRCYSRAKPPLPLTGRPSSGKTLMLQAGQEHRRPPPENP